MDSRRRRFVTWFGHVRKFELPCTGTELENLNDLDQGCPNDLSPSIVVKLGVRILIKLTITFSSIWLIQKNLVGPKEDQKVLKLFMKTSSLGTIVKIEELKNLLTSHAPNILKRNTSGLTFNLRICSISDITLTFYRFLNSGRTRCHFNQMVRLL